MLFKYEGGNEKEDVMVVSVASRDVAMTLSKKEMKTWRGKRRWKTKKKTPTHQWRNPSVAWGLRRGRCRIRRINMLLQLTVLRTSSEDERRLVEAPLVPFSFMKAQNEGCIRGDRYSVASSVSKEERTYDGRAVLQCSTWDCWESNADDDSTTSTFFSLFNPLFLRLIDCLGKHISYLHHNRRWWWWE